MAHIPTQGTCRRLSETPCGPSIAAMPGGDAARRVVALTNCFPATVDNCVPMSAELAQKPRDRSSPAIGTTRFDFQHKVFTVPDAQFRLDRLRNQVMFQLSLGGVVASVALSSLCKTFDIPPDSNDAKLLRLVEKGLKYVKEIRPGDAIPNEVLDGSASWKIDPRHHDIARSKLLVQLVAWLTGSHTGLADTSEALVLIEQPEIKEKINTAFEEAAVKLGYGKENKQKVADMIDQLAREMAYIEALREKVGSFLGIEKKLKMLSYNFRGDRNVVESIIRIQTLLGPPLNGLRQRFTMVDGQTTEIIAALKKLGFTVEFVRTTRDHLREAVLLWEDIAGDWADASLERGEESEHLIARTYRFAATNFAVGQRWSLNVG